MMTRKNTRSDMMMYSLSEFAFILLFLSIGAAALLYGRSLQAEKKAAELSGEVRRLTGEVDFLNELLAEKEHGVVPCWRRPEGVIPQLVGIVTIHDPHTFSVSRVSSGETVSGESSELGDVLRTLFREDFVYAREKNCYLRMKIENDTNSFTLYREIAAVVGAAGIVVVN